MGSSKLFQPFNSRVPICDPQTGLINPTFLRWLQQVTVGTGLDISDGTVSATGGSVWGSITGTLADQTDLATALAATTALFTNTVKGTVPASGGGTVKFLRADQTWAAPIGTTYTTFTSLASGLVPASGGGSVHFLRADGAWITPPDTTYSVFTSTVSGLVPFSGGGTVNFLRADGSWGVPPGTVYSTFTSIATGLVPASGGGSTNFLRADGAWAAPGGAAIFTAGTSGAVPASGGGTSNFLRADGTWTSPTGTTYSTFTSIASGLVPASGGGASNFLRADGAWAVPSGTASAPLFPVIAPPALTGVNLGTSTLTTNSDGTITLVPQDVGSDSVRLAVTALPGTTNWSRTIGLLPEGIVSTGFQTFGLCLRESATGKFLIYGGYRDASANCLWVAMQYNSPTAKVGNISVPGTPSNYNFNHPIYVSAVNNGTTLAVKIGTGRRVQAFLNLTEAYNARFVPDQIGMYYSNTSGGTGPGVTLFSWS